MSIALFRSTIERLRKEKANLEGDLARERMKLSRCQNDISSLSRSITSTTSLSIRKTKQQQIDSKQKELAQIQKKIADLETKISTKIAELHRYLQNLENAEKQEQKKQEQEQKKRDIDAKRRRDEELRHIRSVTSEIDKQVKLQNSIKANRLVIDLALLPETIKVLFLASNPVDQNLLRLDEEIRLIMQKIRASEHRDSVQIIPCWAVRPADLLQALNEHKPHIVHFSGHGLSNGNLVFQNDDGSTKLVSKDAIVTTMSTFTDNIRVVIFNACFSSGQAEAVTRHVDVAIGMNAPIGDTAARVFAAQFYSAIGFGRSIQQAFDQGKAALMLDSIPEESTPLLFTRDNINSEEIILVRPPDMNTIS